MAYKEVEGDLIELGLQGEFEVIAHGCNCFCTMGAGIALPMAETFDCNNPWTYSLEGKTKYQGDINKLGQIQWNRRNEVIAVNCYTQYEPGPNLDYAALKMCLTKLNHTFAGSKIGLPQVGCGIAGGDWEKVKKLIKKRMPDCDVTVVIYKPKIQNNVLVHQTTEANQGD